MSRTDASWYILMFVDIRQTTQQSLFSVIVLCRRHLPVAVKFFQMQVIIHAKSVAELVEAMDHEVMKKNLAQVQIPLLEVLLFILIYLFIS